MSERSSRLPDGHLIAWYGDDFTGATAVMEVLTFSGLPSVLFFDVPTHQQLQNFLGYRGIGIAGSARSKSPEWMDASLPSIFGAMASWGAPINQYKVCSTFDSAPHVGSIGHAAEIAIPYLGGDWHPMLIAAPEIERYQAFGNLFAGIAGQPYRLDRHPVMKKHPVTPMAEADVVQHLSDQTDLPTGLVNILELQSDPERALKREIESGASIIALDCLDKSTLEAAGRLIWENRGERLFAIASQGLEYAMVAYWQSAGLLADFQRPDHPGSVDRVAVVSGSCSPITANQIHNAQSRGFETIRVDPAMAVDSRAWSNELDKASQSALQSLGSGKNPIICTALGPDDPSTAPYREAVESAGISEEQANQSVGEGLGRLLRQMIEQTGLQRGVIAGGDTSSHGASTLGIYALTALAPVAPGAALCRAHSESAQLAGFEIALKGGQMGGPDYFETVKNGGLAA